MCSQRIPHFFAMAVVTALVSATVNAEPTEQTVFKKLGEWTCRADAYYYLNVDPLGKYVPGADAVPEGTIRIAVEQELTALDSSDRFLLRVEGDLGEKLRIVVTVGNGNTPLQGLFGTYKKDGEAAQGEPTFSGLPPTWSDKKKSLEQLTGVYNNGFWASSYVMFYLEKDVEETWSFALTRHSLTTPRQAKAVGILSGHKREPEAGVAFLTGDCLRE